MRQYTMRDAVTSDAGRALRRQPEGTACVISVPSLDSRGMGEVEGTHADLQSALTQLGVLQASGSGRLYAAVQEAADPVARAVLYWDVWVTPDDQELPTPDAMRGRISNYLGHVRHPLKTARLLDPDSQLEKAADTLAQAAFVWRLALTGDESIADDMLACAEALTQSAAAGAQDQVAAARAALAVCDRAAKHLKTLK